MTRGPLLHGHLYRLFPLHGSFSNRLIRCQSYSIQKNIKYIEKNDHHDESFTSATTTTNDMIIGDQFYKDALSGITGKLAIAYERQNWNQLIHLHQIIKSHQIPLQSTLPMNYIINAYLNTNQPVKAYSLLKDMESLQLPPSVMTFEVLMNALSKYSYHGIQIEELWTLMTKKYQMEPSDNCWQSRIGVWISRPKSTTVIAIQLLEEYKKNLIAKNKHPDLEILANLFVISVRKCNWTFANRLLMDSSPHAFSLSSLSFSPSCYFFYSSHYKRFMEELMLYHCNQSGILRTIIDRFKGVPYEGLLSKCLNVAYRISMNMESSLSPSTITTTCINCNNNNRSSNSNSNNKKNENKEKNNIERVATWSFEHLIKLSIHDGGIMSSRYLKTFSFIMERVNPENELYKKLKKHS